MKIDPTTTRLLGNIVSNAKTGNASAKPSALATQPDANTAVLRSDRIGASGPGDFDAAKVERVRSAIEAGTYAVKPEALADGMLDDARAFLSSGVF